MVPHLKAEVFFPYHGLLDGARVFPGCCISSKRFLKEALPSRMISGYGEEAGSNLFC